MTREEREALRRAIDEAKRQRISQSRRKVEASVTMEPPPAPVRLCRTEGCSNPATEQYDRGIFAELCEGDCMEEARRAASLRAGGTQQRWTEATVVDAIRMWARENGGFPSSTHFQKGTDQYPAYHVVRKFFASWIDALAAAGCPTNVPNGLVHVAADGSVFVMENMQVTKVSPTPEAAPDPAPQVAPEPNPDPAPEEPEPDPRPEPDEPAPPVNRNTIEALLRELDPECQIDTAALVVAAAFMGCQLTTLKLTFATRAPYRDVAECVDRMQSCGLWRNGKIGFESDPDDPGAVVEFWLHVLVAGGEIVYLAADKDPA